MINNEVLAGNGSEIVHFGAFFTLRGKLQRLCTIALPWDCIRSALSHPLGRALEHGIQIAPHHINKLCVQGPLL